jgi:hypothetical protein
MYSIPIYTVMFYEARPPILSPSRHGWLLVRAHREDTPPSQYFVLAVNASVGATASEGRTGAEVDDTRVKWHAIPLRTSRFLHGLNQTYRQVVYIGVALSSLLEQRSALVHYRLVVQGY